MLIAIAVGVALLVSLGAPIVLKPLLQRLGVIDVPNERSSHSRPVIRGGGLAPLLGLVTGFAVLLLSGADQVDALLLLIVALVSLAAGVLGWLEDSRGLPVAVRAGTQLLIGVAGAGVAVSIAGASWWLVAILAIGIAGYINVANFMDGINGISGLHGVVVGASFALVGALADVTWMVPAGLIIAAAFLGFLPWNLRGNMFLGDVGSYLLGGSIAAVAVAAVVSGVPPLAVLGPLAIYLADAGFTLIRRIVRGERWHEAHRTHVYQRVTDGGLSHLQTSIVVAVFTLLTSALGLINLTASVDSVILSGLAIVAVVGLYLALPAMLGASTQRGDSAAAAPSLPESDLPLNKPRHSAQKWAVVGASGFIGSALAREIAARGFSVVHVTAPRVVLSSSSTAEVVLKQVARYEAEVTSLVQQFAGVDVVVNAAGLATPDSSAQGALFGANALLPVLVASAADSANVSRTIHLSSAAVQGRREVLDESAATAPFSPYSCSKALGESAILSFLETSVNAETSELVILRATSVQGAGRPTTQQLGRLARSRFSSVAGLGDKPTVVSSLRGLIEFVVAVGTFSGPVPTIVLQPWEGLTTAKTLEVAGQGEPIRLPLAFCRAAVASGYVVGRVLPRVHGIVRRVELMWFGQDQDASWARSVGLEGNSYVADVFHAESVNFK